MKIRIIDPTKSYGPGDKVMTVSDIALTEVTAKFANDAYRVTFNNGLNLEMNRDEVTQLIDALTKAVKASSAISN